MTKDEAVVAAPGAARSPVSLALGTWIRSIWRPAAMAPDMALLVFVIVTLPLEFTKQFFPIQEIEVARIGMVACIGWLAYQALRRRLRSIAVPVVAAVALVIIVNTLSLLATRWPGGAKEVAALAVYAAFGLFVAQTLRTPGRLAVAACALAFSGAVVGLVAVAQELGDFYVWTIRPGLEKLGRRNSTFGDPNIAARQLGMSLCAVLAVLGTLPARRVLGSPRIAAPAAATLLLIGAGLLLTLSRSGWLFVALVVVVAWIPIAIRRPQVAVALVVFVAGFIGGSVINPSAGIRVGEMASLVGIRQRPTAPPVAPYTILPEAGSTIDPSSQLLSWGANDPYEMALLHTEATIEIVDEEGNLTEPPRPVPARPARDFIGARLDSYEEAATRDVQGPATLAPGEARQGEAGLDITVDELAPDATVTVVGDAVRDDLSGISGGAPLRIWVRASELEALKSVELVFRFSPRARAAPPDNFATYRITPSAAGEWQEFVLPRAAVASSGGWLEWDRIERIDLRIEAGPGAPYSGTLSVDDLRIGSALEPGETYHWRVKVANERGYSGYTDLRPFRVEDEVAGPARFVAEVARTTVLAPIINRLPVDEVRRYQMHGGVAMFLDHPLFGVGLAGADEMLVGPYFEFVPPDHRSAPIALLHTELVKIAAETGVLGLLAYGALLVVGLVLIWRFFRAGDPVARMIALGLFSGLLLIVLSSQSEGRFYSEPYLWLYTGALAGLAVAYRAGYPTAGGGSRPSAPSRVPS